MPVERRGQVTDVGSEPTGNRRSSILNGRRQPSCGGTSRMTREARGEIPRAYSAFASFRARSRYDRLTPMNGNRQYLTQRMRAELFKIDGKLAALQARVDAVLPDTKGA